MASPEGGNFGRFCDPRFDAVNRAAYSTFDPAVRRKYYAIAQRLFYEDVPQILLWGRPTLDVVPKRLQFTDADGDTFVTAGSWHYDSTKPQ
jgi:ABC-type transport system substrate-binding protein